MNRELNPGFRILLGDSGCVIYHLKTYVLICILDYESNNVKHNIIHRII